MEHSDVSSRTLEKALLKYVSKEVFCDVTLVSDDLQQFPAHKLVLGAHSPVLESLLLSLKQNNENTVLHMRGYTGTSIQKVLNFMYSGKDLLENDLNFVNLANDLKIPGLMNVATDSNNIRPAVLQEDLGEISRTYFILKQANISLNLFEDKAEEKKNRRGTVIKVTPKNSGLDINKTNEESIPLKLIEDNSEEKKIVNRKEVSTITDYDIFDEDVIGEKPKLPRLSYYKIMDNMLECVFCDQVEKNKDNLVHHVRTFHSEIKEYKCKICAKKFKSVVHLEYHFYAHPHHPYQCITCDYTNERKGNVRSHYIDQHLPKYHKKRYACKRCSYTTHNHQLMQAHVQRVHGEGAAKFECEQCGALLTGKSSLLGHIKLKHKKERFPCSKCPYRASSKSFLKIHEEGIHDGVLRECTQCEYKSKTPFGLKKHIDVNHRGIRYNCNQCPKVFRNKFQLKKHELKKHNVPHTFQEHIVES